MPSPPYQAQILLDQAAQEPRQVPGELAEVSPNQWALWRNHPLSVIFFRKYLPDFRRALERQTMDRWIGGGLSLAFEQEARGYLLAINLLENGGLDDVRQFYGMDSARDQGERAARP